MFFFFRLKTAVGRFLSDQQQTSWGKRVGGLDEEEKLCVRSRGLTSMTKRLSARTQFVTHTRCRAHPRVKEGSIKREKKYRVCCSF